MRRLLPWRPRHRTAVFSPGGLQNYKNNSPPLSILSLRDDYRMKMQRATLCYWPEDR
jgi:hypothetical protein